MLQKLSIRNFRSLKDVSVDLQKINLLIGPNNSGKSNFLKAFEFLYLFFNKEKLTMEDFSRNYFGFWEPVRLDNKTEPITFGFSYRLGKDRYEHYLLEIFGASGNHKPIYRELIGIAKEDLHNIKIDNVKLYKDSFYSFKINIRNNAPVEKVLNNFELSSPNIHNYVLFLNEDNKLSYSEEDFYGLNFIQSFQSKLAYQLSFIFLEILIYEPDTYKLINPGKLGTENYLEKDASNLVSFLDNMRDSNPEILEAIRHDLQDCIEDFADIRFEKVDKEGVLFKRIGLIDKRNKVFWADELSEGTLYFLALLSIIHQPDPPRLVLLEEPEKGIHPRRIHEVMEYIFRMAHKKEIQIILTSHSPHLVDEFYEMPESVFVFEMENGLTKVRNLLTDIIEPSDIKSEKNGLPKIKYTEPLGDHWFQGFLGGVPR